VPQALNETETEWLGCINNYFETCMLTNKDRDDENKEEEEKDYVLFYTS
jgi:hypothetical protein